MASKTLGRIACPIGCGHEAAQVKLKTDKEAGKTAYPYVHCAGCSIQLHTRNQEQAQHLLKATRPEKGAQTDEKAPPGVESVPVAVQVPPTIQTPPAPAKRPGLLDGWLLGGSGVPA